VLASARGLIQKRWVASAPAMASTTKAPRAARERKLRCGDPIARADSQHE
jgi:hypothetical protein